MGLVFRHSSLSLRLNTVLVASFVVLLGAIAFVLNRNINNITMQSALARAYEESVLMEKRLEELRQEHRNTGVMLTSFIDAGASFDEGRIVFTNESIVKDVNFNVVFLFSEDCNCLAMYEKTPDLQIVNSTAPITEQGVDVSIIEAARNPSTSVDGVVTATPDLTLTLEPTPVPADMVEGASTAEDEAQFRALLRDQAFRADVLMEVPPQIETDYVIDISAEPKLMVRAIVPTYENGVKTGALVVNREVNDVVLDTVNFDRDRIHLGVIYEDRFITTQVPLDAVENSSITALAGIPIMPELLVRAQRGETVFNSELEQENSDYALAESYVPLRNTLGDVVAVVLLLIESDQFAGFRQSTLGSSLMLISLLGLATVLAIILVMRQLAIQPIQKLTRFAEQLADGQPIAVDEPITESTEVGRLANAFNSMASQIAQRTAELEMSNGNLARVNKELQDFTYIVTHDLRSPVVSIKGFNQTLDMIITDLTTVTPGTEACRVTLDNVMQEINETSEALGIATEQMERLVNAVLKLSREGSRKLKLEKLDMATIAQNLVRTRAPQAQARHAELTVGDCPPLVADRASIEQVIGNLLDNALRYNQPPRLNQIHVWGEETNDEVIYHVRDTGRGIDKNDQERIFLMFRRAGLSDTEGEGIGLTYIQVWVRRHGGQITVESEPNVGSTFSFTISKKLAEDEGNRAS